MNLSHINCAHAVALALLGSVSLSCNAQTSASLDTLIQKSISPAGIFYTSRMAPHMDNWEGIRSVAGLNLILSKHMAEDLDPEANLACHYLLENFQLPKERVATAMMARARVEAVNDEKPWRLVYVLRRMEKMIDREKQGAVVVPFIAQYLTDQRFTEPQQRGEDSTPRQRLRVCDGATNVLINYLEETGLCQKYDARFGDPGGHTMWAQRDQVTRAVVQVLQEKKLLPLDFWQKAPLPRQSPPTAGQLNLSPALPKKPVEIPPYPPQDGVAKQSDAYPLSWMWAMVGICLAACGLALWLWKSRQGKPPSL